MKIRLSAEWELREIFDWNEDQRAGREDRRPSRNVACVYTNASRAILRRFPFLIFYRVDTDEVTILTVIHSNRHPSEWKSRF